MVTTRAGQIVCKSDWDDFTGGSNEIPMTWFVDTQNGFNGEVRFEEYLLRKYDYYKSYKDDLGKNFYDIRFILEGFKQDSPSPAANLSKNGGEDMYIKNEDIYCVRFKPIRNNKYAQNFSFVLRNSENNGTLTIQSFSIPAKTNPQEYELYFCPETFGVSNDFDEIIFQVQRENLDSTNVIMELEYFEMYKLKNMLEGLKDENENEIQELLGLEIETVNRGECLLFINFDSFWVGNDKKLKIDEDLEISVQKLAYVKHRLPTGVQYADSDYITCLINYKY